MYLSACEDRATFVCMLYWKDRKDRTPVATFPSHANKIMLDVEVLSIAGQSRRVQTDVLVDPAQHFLVPHERVLGLQHPLSASVSLSLIHSVTRENKD